MIYKRLKGTSFEVSAVAMGSALFGATYSEDFSRGQLDLFCEGGGNFIDTAHVYNDWIPGDTARSEKVIGRWIKSRGMAGKVIVVTKGAHPPMDSMQTSRVRQDCIAEDLKESLENLGLDAIDLYLLHRDDPSVPIGELVGWMNEHIQDGLIRHWGVSNWRLDRIQAANEYAQANGLQGIALNQTMWSFASIAQEGLEDQTLVPLDRAAYDYHCVTGMNLMAFTSQAKGYFARRDAGENLPPDVLRVYGTPANDQKYAFLKKCRDETGLSIAALSLYFFYRHPFAAIPVVSYDTDELLRATLDAYSGAAQAMLDQLDFPLIF